MYTIIIRFINNKTGHYILKRTKYIPKNTVQLTEYDVIG